VRARVLASVLFVAAGAWAQSAPAERKLVDEVVAVVDAHSITLSELSAETRIHLVEQQGGQVAGATPDRALLAASLRRLVEERVILAEVDRLRLFDLERAEVDTALARFRARFPTAEAYDRFLDRIQMTADEVASVLARDLRVARYLDNRLKLAAQVREGELDEAMRAYPGVDRASLRQKLAREKYERLLEGLLADLRRKADVRILDPLEDDGRSIAAGRIDGGVAEVR
jgi:SurA N-terminal domain